MWTLSGLYFSLIPIEEIRGNHLLTKNTFSKPTLSELPLLSPQEIAIRNPNISGVEVSDITLNFILGRPIYLIADQRFDAISGKALPMVSRNEALSIVRARTNKEILDAQIVKRVAVDSEYRNGELPAWRITLTEKNAAIYVGSKTARIRAVRTDSWRLFDFLWSLHIMDYEERENFNHLLIQTLAIISLITVISGLILFFSTFPFRIIQNA